MIFTDPDLNWAIEITLEDGVLNGRKKELLRVGVTGRIRASGMLMSANPSSA
jgi:hypothetical protein